MSTATIAGPVVCRNKMSGPTVIASDQRSTHEVIFGGAGDPEGKDVQYIPQEILQTPQFAAALAKGILEVVSGEDNEQVKAALQNQTDAFWNRAAKDNADALATLEAPADNDLIAIPCIGPGTREGAVCGETVPVRQREQGNQPPLCARHEALTERCVKRGTGPWELLPA